MQRSFTGTCDRVYDDLPEGLDLAGVGVERDDLGAGLRKGNDQGQAYIA